MAVYGFIGAGNMAYAMAGALFSSGKGGGVYVYDVSTERIAAVKELLPRVQACGSVADLVSAADVVVLAVKPQVMPAVMADLVRLPEGLTGSGGPLYISIAAGLPLSFFLRHMPKARVVRVMPNTPALVGQAASGYTPGPGVTDGDLALVRLLLESAGRAVQVEEPLLDSVTGLSGSGPAFFARIAEAFIEAGVSQGLTPEAARILTLQTMKGTAELMERQNLDPEELVRMVSSPGGTTVAGREVLEASELKNILAATVKRAVERSKELGK
jgi:pyrroline-5-carboxylate reductase